jgi:hypothetical protein
MARGVPVSNPYKIKTDNTVFLTEYLMPYYRLLLVSMLFGPLLQGIDVFLCTFIVQSFFALAYYELIYEPNDDAWRKTDEETEPEQGVVVGVLPCNEYWRYAENDDQP